jgi:hypothetical protein
MANATITALFALVTVARKKPSAGRRLTGRLEARRPLRNEHGCLPETKSRPRLPTL